jgi:hypothetical protein
MNFKFITGQRLGDYARWLLFLPILMLLIGCKSEEQDRREKYRTTVNPENGKLVTVKGEKFRIVYIGGVRFQFPDTPDRQFGWTGQFAASPITDGVDMHFYWPDIPRGKAPGTKYAKRLDGKYEVSNLIIVLVRGRSEEEIMLRDNKTPEQWFNLSATNYIVRDNKELGLRTFTSKKQLKDRIAQDWFQYAYTLTEDAIEPWSGKPVEILYGSIHFNYAPKVRVEIRLPGNIDKNWKDTYLGVVETLNKYRED